MTPAEELRAAAKAMRERAEAATEGPWQHMCMGSDGCLVLRKHRTVRERGRGRVAKFWLKDWQADHKDAEHVAGMHPGVALAVADWLEAEADWAGSRPDLLLHSLSPGPLAVARAYLGSGQ